MPGKGTQGKLLFEARLSFDLKIHSVKAKRSDKKGCKKCNTCRSYRQHLYQLFAHVFMTKSL